MHLSPEQVQRFYRIWFPLLTYVNEQRNLVPTFADSLAANSVDPGEAVPLRNAMWEDDSLRAGFIADNPADLPPEDLALVESWEHRVQGNFFIERYFKKYAVFLGEGDTGYGVLGLTDSIEEMFFGDAPLYVNTVLIPFEDVIIYDSLISTYQISFGGGYKASFKDTYRAIQERGGLVTRLPHDPIPDKAAVRAGNKKVLTALKRHIGSGMSARKAEEHVENITTFAEVYLLAQSPPVFLRDLTPELLERYADDAENVNWVSLKRLVWFLRDTGRVYYEDAEEMLDVIADLR
jgi:hypothetical protein